MTRRRDWDTIAGLDSRWAVLSTPEGKYGHWDDDAFFATGAEEIAALLEVADALHLPQARERALDFGCGLGRLTRALAPHFRAVVGIDISAAMVREAKTLNAHVANATFVLNEGDDLRLFGDRSFDLVCSTYVLQHLPSRSAVERAIGELVRVLRPGGLLAFQLPVALDPIVRLQPRTTLYRALRRAGVTPKTLYWRLGLHPMRMLAVPEDAATDAVDRSGGRVVRVDESRDARARTTNARYFVTRCSHTATAPAW